MKTRVIHTKFWQDSYIADLNPTEKLLFIYLLTNAYINLSGVYECSARIIQFETGLSSSQIENSKDKFQSDNKFIFFEDWVKVVNIEKYQNYKGAKNEIAKKRELEHVPDTLSIPYRYPIDSTRNKKSKIRNKKSENIASKKFKKPTLDEIKKYCQERKNNVDPTKFFNHYESNGWKVGRNPMKDWQAAVRTWERNSFDNQKTSSNAPKTNKKAKEDTRHQLQRQEDLRRYSALINKYYDSKYGVGKWSRIKSLDNKHTITATDMNLAKKHVIATDPDLAIKIKNYK